MVADRDAERESRRGTPVVTGFLEEATDVSRADPLAVGVRSPRAEVAVSTQSPSWVTNAMLRVVLVVDDPLRLRVEGRRVAAVRRRARDVELGVGQRDQRELGRDGGRRAPVERDGQRSLSRSGTETSSVGEVRAGRRRRRGELSTGAFGGSFALNGAPAGPSPPVP